MILTFPLFLILFALIVFFAFEYFNADILVPSYNFSLIYTDKKHNKTRPKKRLKVFFFLGVQFVLLGWLNLFLVEWNLVLLLLTHCLGGENLFLGLVILVLLLRNLFLLEWKLLLWRLELVLAGHNLLLLEWKRMIWGWKTVMSCYWVVLGSQR